MTPNPPYVRTDEDYDDFMEFLSTEQEREQNAELAADRLFEKSPVPAWLRVSSELREAA